MPIMPAKMSIALSIATIALSACGASSGNSSSISGSATTIVPPRSSTTSTQVLIPTSSPLPALCSAYFTVLADAHLQPKIAQLSPAEQSSALAAFQAAIAHLSTSPLAPPALTSSSALGLLSHNITFAPSKTTLAPTALTGALAELKVSLQTTCQAVRPSSTQASAIASTAASQGWSNSCGSVSTLAISSADPTYALLEISPAATKSPGTTCFANGSSGVLERLTGKVWNVLQTFNSYPCGQAPPDVLYSFFGSSALDTCYP